MSTVEDGLRSQLRNIENTYGRSIDDWIGLIQASGRRRHGEIVPWLKSEYGLTHGAAHRVALMSIEAMAPRPEVTDPEVVLYPGTKGALLPIHARLMSVLTRLGTDIVVVPKTGYLSLRRRKQFGMIKPAAKHIDLGLVLDGRAPAGRLESAATFNALFTHRVRVRSVDDVDDELVGWISEAYVRAE